MMVGMWWAVARRLYSHNGRLPLAPSVCPTDRTSLKETACLVKISLEIAITFTDAMLTFFVHYDHYGVFEV